jgi:mono/diheme cytochrome c family protein
VTTTLGISKAVALAATIPITYANVPRGCPACHVLRNPQTGGYTLAFEAINAAKAAGADHPTTAPDGTSMKATDAVSVTTCFECHAPGTGARLGMGNKAPLALMDIVHPAHMSSPTFVREFQGNCFTCHDVNGKGQFEILTQAVDDNAHGVPNPDKLPVPGEIVGP